VPGIEEAHHRRGNIALVGFRTCRQEERVVLSPCGEKGRLRVSEIPLEGGVKCDVGLVVAEQIELRFISPRPREVELSSG